MPSDSVQFLASCAVDSQEQSVCKKFKGQLFNLIDQLECTTPHFIRCIRPNTKQLPDIYDEDLVLQQLKCSGILEVVRTSRAGYPTRMTHQEFSTRYGFLLSEANKYQDPLSTSVAILQQFNIPSEMYQFGYTKLYLRAGQTGSLELKRKQVLQGIVVVQKYFRGYQARSYFQELKKGVATFQSFVRGEITRRKFGVMKPSITIYSKNLEEIQAIIQLQSVIRGWLARKDASTPNGFKSYPENAKHRRKSLVKMLEVKQDISKERVQNLPSPLAQLQRRVDKAEEENAKLREQLKQSERKWAEYEAKMKSMEEAWQKQRASLQMSLVAARKSLASDSGNTQPTRNEVLSPRYYGSEDATLGSRTAVNTPIKFSSNFAVSDGGREANGIRERGTSGTLSSLMKEFDQRRQNFDDEVKALNDVKPGNSTTTNSIEEFRKLKQSFEGWKKQYKVRLRETKAKLHEADKSRRTWWGKLKN
ncbi:myosin-2 isoform X1 [Arachis hypogaea]|nr:myosin-2 isoform X1 [Arachis hypogaea]